MKTWIMFIGLALSPFALALSDNTVLPDWYDYVKCDFCKEWGAHPGLIAHSLDESRPISDGIVWITTVEKEYRADFRRVQKAEAQVADDMGHGKSVQLCQACKRLVDFGAAGVRIESVDGTNATVTIFTSSDTSMVRQLHEFGVTAIAEETNANAKFLASKKGMK